MVGVCCRRNRLKQTCFLTEPTPRGTPAQADTLCGLHHFQTLTSEGPGPAHTTGLLTHVIRRPGHVTMEAGAEDTGHVTVEAEAVAEACSVLAWSWAGRGVGAPAADHTTTETDMLALPWRGRL